ncbi:MAG: MFS transporter [Victivallales bacterium]|nr:MFS transporter [Victivallales bacterium]
MKFTDVFKNKSTAFSFFLSIIVWGIGTGCFAATLNNFLSDMHGMTSLNRGMLEFFREMPGLALVFLFALLNRMSDWKILRLGTMISMLGAALLFVPSNKVIVTFFIMIWSLGEHLIMPVRQAIAIQIAKPENAGQSLGFLTSAMNFGNVTGSAIVAVIFYVGVHYSGMPQRYLYDIVWGLIAVLMIVSTISTFNKNAPDETAKRPKLYFHRKFNKFYALELFYGARKQIFFTFAPYVLIREYGFSTARMAVLLAVCAIINIFAAPAIGKLTDKLGYRNIMIWDTIILCFVCLLYGFAGDIFPRNMPIGLSMSITSSMPSSARPLSPRTSTSVALRNLMMNSPLRCPQASPSIISSPFLQVLLAAGFGRNTASASCSPSPPSWPSVIPFLPILFPSPK